MSELNLEKLLALAKATTSGPWEADTIRNEGSYGGGPNPNSGFNSYALFAGGKTLLDTLNSDAAIVHVENGNDYENAWDDVGRRNIEFIAAANPTVVEELVQRLMEAEEKWSYYQNFVKEPAADLITNLVIQRNSAIKEMEKVKAERDALKAQIDGGVRALVVQRNEGKSVCYYGNDTFWVNKHHATLIFDEPEQGGE